MLTFQTTRCQTALYHIALYHIALYHIALYHITLYHITLYRIVLYHIALGQSSCYRIAPATQRSPKLSATKLVSSVLCSTIL